jgi:hypothetical protein
MGPRCRVVCSVDALCVRLFFLFFSAGCVYGVCCMSNERETDGGVRVGVGGGRASHAYSKHSFLPPPLPRFTGLGDGGGRCCPPTFSSVAVKDGEEVGGVLSQHILSYIPIRFCSLFYERTTTCLSPPFLLGLRCSPSATPLCARVCLWLWTGSVICRWRCMEVEGGGGTSDQR